MDVSWNWLQQYVDITGEMDQVVDRLTMSGLNHESTEAVGGDYCIDLEVTSNRGDCLGHIGVAREIATLFEWTLKIPAADPKTNGDDVNSHVNVAIECPELCTRYTARLIRGVKIGPSPKWLLERLQTIGIESVNNVVDVSNYVMMECGQPLHTFDFGSLADSKIIVREANEGETLEAINHLNYELSPGMCIIGDGAKPVGIGGVMGGAGTEISDNTKDVLIEAAWFSPASIRSTARKLNLHSDSSFRFERNVDLAGIDWASRRCAELILEVAGGELLNGVVDVGQSASAREPVTLRPKQISRILGIDIPEAFSKKTLVSLGLELTKESSDTWQFTPPSWRKDLSREIDLIEEVGRIYGYENVPDNVTVPMSASHRSKTHRILDRVHSVMLASGFDEAMCPSLLPQVWADSCSPWSDLPPLVADQPMLGVLEKGSQNVGAVNCLRRTLIPSLLEAKRINDYRSNDSVNLFETANIYLANKSGLPSEPLMLGMVSEQDFHAVKAVVEATIREINPSLVPSFVECELNVLDVSQNAWIEVDGERVGVIGAVAPGALKDFGLRQQATVAELRLDKLGELLHEVHSHQAISGFPAVSRDFNFVVDEAVAWDRLESTVRSHAGELLESIAFREIFRNEQKDGPGKKRVLLSIQLRSFENTLSSDDVEQVSKRVISSCQSELGATLAS
ncbi:MAG: phenylalanine--tRNA ligase subunit beta [Pirellulaceae bacterium]